QVVMELRIEHCDKSIIAGDGRKREQASAIDHIHVLGHRGLPDDWIVGAGPHKEPKSTDRSLLCGALGAVTAANFTNFVKVFSPCRGIKRRRRRRTELRTRSHDPRARCSNS